MLRLALVTPPTDLPVDVSTVKEHLRVDFTDDDYLLTQYIQAATDALDGWSGILGRALMPQSWKMTEDRFPLGCIRIPLGPVTAVTSIKYRDADNVLQTVPTADYQVDISRFEALIRAPAGWPGTGDYLGAVEIEWTAGNGCPPPIRVAIMILAAHMYENRTNGAEMPKSVTDLVAPFRRVVI